MAVTNAFARYKGEHLDDYINRTFAGGENREPIGNAVLHQELLTDLKANIVEYVQKVVTTKDNNLEPFIFNKVLPIKREQVLNETGMDIGAARELLIPSKVIHADNRHNLTNSDWEKLPEIALDFTTSFQSSSHDNRVVFVKKDDATGYLYVAEFFSGKNKGERLQLTTYFKDHINSVKSWLNDHTLPQKNNGGDITAGGDPSLPKHDLESTPNDAHPPLDSSVANQRSDIHTLLQDSRGAVSFLNDGRAVLHALKNPDISTIMHELAHVWRRQLEPEEVKIANEFFAEPGNKWTRNSEEKFARAFEKYLSDGKSPNEELKGVFEKFKSWLVDIYRGIVGSPLEMQITGNVRHMFDTISPWPRSTSIRDTSPKPSAPPYHSENT